MCSGGAMPRCIVDLTAYYLGLALQEKCGECSGCQEVLPRIYELLRQISRGEGEVSLLDELSSLAEQVLAGETCPASRIGARMVKEALADYDEEFAAHLTERYCPAGVCDIRYVVEV